MTEREKLCKQICDRVELTRNSLEVTVPLLLKSMDVPARTREVVTELLSATSSNLHPVVQVAERLAKVG